MMPAYMILWLTDLLEQQSVALLQDGLIKEASAAIAQAERLKLLAVVDGALWTMRLKARLSSFHGATVRRSI